MAPIYTLNNSALRLTYLYTLLLLHPSQHLFPVGSHFEQLWGDNLVVLIGISLMISDPENPSVCILAICMSAFKRCLFRYSGLLWILFFDWIWFANNFSHSVDCLFTLLMVSFIIQKFLVWCSVVWCSTLFSLELD